MTEKINYENVVVNKPWGSEYLCYRNEDVAIWFLHILQGKETSMHCHPNKNTGFVVLNGEAKLSFLRNSIDLKSLDKIHIFRSRFHSTKAISEQGAYIFEIETPEDKHDLVRLEDSYGRAGKEYEGANAHVPKTDDCIWIDEPSVTPKELKLFNHVAVHKKIESKEELLDQEEETLFIITQGGLVTKDNQRIVWPGDVCDGKTLSRLANAFDIDVFTSMIIIK